MTQGAPDPAPEDGDTPSAPSLILNKTGGWIKTAFDAGDHALPVHVRAADAPWLADALLAMAAHPGAVEAYARALLAMADPAVPASHPRRFAVPGVEGDAGEPLERDGDA